MLLQVLCTFGLVFAACGDEIEDIHQTAMENPDLFGGDMLGVDPEDDRNVHPLDRYRWPNGRVPYIIDQSLAAAMPVIQKAFDHYRATTCVRFVPRKNEENYIRLFSGDGCYSNVGMIGKQQQVSLGRGCVNVGTIVHELGHALGFYHEQNRSDRDDYLDIFMENVMKGQEVNFKKLRPSQNLLLTPFDLKSIMIYGNTAFSVDKKSHTMRAKNGQMLLNPYSKQGMTQSDIKRINMMYNCPPTLSN